MTTEILDSYPRSATRPVVGESTFTGVHEDAARLRVLLNWCGKGAAAPVRQGCCCTSAARELLHWCGKGAAAPVQQGCCCTGTPGRTPPVAAWEGGVVVSDLRCRLALALLRLSVVCLLGAQRVWRPPMEDCGSLAVVDAKVAL